MGFEAMTSAIPVRCSTNWAKAMKPLYPQCSHMIYIYIHIMWCIIWLSFLSAEITGRTDWPVRSAESSSTATREIWISSIVWKYFGNTVGKRSENPISIVLSNSIVWKCFPWCGNIREILWKYYGNKTPILWKRCSLSSVDYRII